MSSASSTWSLAANPTRFLPSHITPYLRKISHSGIFQDTIQAVRFVRRFLTYQTSKTNTKHPLTFTFRAPCETEEEDDGKVRRILCASGSLGGGAPTTIFANGPPQARVTSSPNMDGYGQDGIGAKGLPSKALTAARVRLNESRKSRSSASKQLIRGKKVVQKPFTPSPKASLTRSLAVVMDQDAMDVDECPVAPPSQGPTSFSVVSPRPLTRSESVVSYSDTTGVTIKRTKRKGQQCTDSPDVVIKRLHLSVSMTSVAQPTSHTLPDISTESVLGWIQSQASIHHLVAERLKAFFVPAYLSEKPYQRRMRKLTPIVNEIAFVVRSPYSTDGSQHWLVLKDDVQASLGASSHLRYGQTVARILLGRAERGIAPRQEQHLFPNRARKRSPLMNEL